MSFTLRDYQSECLDALKYGHQEHDSILAELATGLGKTVLFTKYASSWQHGRSLVIAPQIPLIGQAAKKILKETGIMPAIEQADQWSNESPWARNDFIVASKQSLCSGNGTKRYERFVDVGLVIVDEAHYACTEQYADMITWFRDRGAKVLGVTATAKRHDKRAMGQVFDECVFQYGIAEAIEDGWLVPIKVTCKQLEKLDLSGVDTSNTFMGKDFNQKQLNEKLENPEVIYEIAEAVATETRGEKTAVFCSSVDEAQAVAELLVDSYNIKADWICAHTKRCPDQHRLDVMQSFTDLEDEQAVSHVCNVGILTTGWDFPGLKNIVMARPTRSKPLYQQILGRVTRAIEVDGCPVVDFDGSIPETRKAAVAASEKPFGRVIDLVDNSITHKIVTAVDVLGGKWSLAKREFILKESSKGANDIAAKAAEFDEEERKREEALRAQRAAKRAEAKFRDQEVDPFSGSRAGARMTTQKVMATDKQRRYLWVLGIKDINGLTVTKSQAGRMISQLKSGISISEVRRTNRLSKGDAQPASKPDRQGDAEDVNRLLWESAHE